MGYRVIVRYGAMGFVGEFNTELADLKRGDTVVVRTDRGSEAGQVVGPLSQTSEEKQGSSGEVLRLFTAQDEKEVVRIESEAVPEEMSFCRRRIGELELPMKLVAAEHLLGGEKIIFYFLADGRVDFRQLVKDIARQYKTRIELRQIGVRDEARLLAEYGHCGQQMCCRAFIKSLEPVTMRMAKSQKATLDPSKISGVCGRLMCCLRYEDSLYRELKSKLPKKGSFVRSVKADGKVVSSDILGQTVVIQTAAANLVRVRLDEVSKVEDAAAARPDGDEKSAGQDGAAAEGTSSEKKAGGGRRGGTQKRRGRRRGSGKRGQRKQR
jgi:cell fate regulator YaaT (PSP1 superfamily)